MDAFLLACAILGAPENDPPLEDLYRLPSRRTAKAMRKFIGQHRTYLEARLNWDYANAQTLWDARFQANAAYKAWDMLDDAANEDVPEESRRGILRELKLTLGSDYYLGKMPCVAIHLFTKLP